MPVKLCPENGKYRIGDGPCMYKTKELAEKAQEAYHSKREQDMKKTIISDDSNEDYKIEKATFHDVKELLRKALKEQFVFENGYLRHEIDFDPEYCYFSVSYSEYKDNKYREYEKTYKVEYFLDGVTVSLGLKPYPVEKETKYTDVKDKHPMFSNDGDMNKDMNWVESIIEKVLNRKKNDKCSVEKEVKEKDGSFYIEKFKEEEMISYEPLYCPPESADYVGEGMTENETLKMVKQIKEKIDSGNMTFSLFHKVDSDAAEWVDCFANPWPSCFVGDQEVLKSQPVGILQWKNKAAWELRKQGVIKGPSVEGKAGNRRKVNNE